MQKLSKTHGLVSSGKLAAFVLAAAIGLSSIPAFSWASEENKPDLNSLPSVRTDLAREIAPGVTLIPDPRVNYVPNIGVIQGRKAILVVDTGLGPLNGQRLLDYVKKLAGNRKIYLTSTHFHPEHNYGSQVFARDATIILNKNQAEELAEKGQSYLNLFRQFGPNVENALQHVIITSPTQTYEHETILDLGGKKVVLREMPAHTRGDQIIYVPDSGVVFLGDLVEDRFFPIMPDSDSKGGQWIKILKDIEAMHPKIVVPGHGNLGDVRQIETVRNYLETVQYNVKALIKLNLSQLQITKALQPMLMAIHPDWDNSVFIPYEIAIYYSELTGSPVQLPKLETDLKQPS